MEDGPLPASALPVLGGRWVCESVRVQRSQHTFLEQQLSPGSVLCEECGKGSTQLFSFCLLSLLTVAVAANVVAQATCACPVDDCQAAAMAWEPQQQQGSDCGGLPTCWIRLHAHTPAHPSTQVSTCAV